MTGSAANAKENFDQAELDKFGALANRWWDPQGPQKALHALNPVRLDYVKQRIALRGASVLDVGCGAGLLSEAMAREGSKSPNCTSWNRRSASTTGCSRWSRWRLSSRAVSMRSPAWKCWSMYPTRPRSSPPARRC
jgi:cyclopropane fatty-acyl-phospholipid synthase-like methyltransferase